MNGAGDVWAERGKRVYTEYIEYIEYIESTWRI